MCKIIIYNKMIRFLCFDLKIINNKYLLETLES